MKKIISTTIKDLLINLENELEEELSELIKGYECKVNINYEFKLIENTIDDNMHFRILLIEGSSTRKRIEFKCTSNSILFKESIINSLSEMINSNREYEDLKELIEHSRLNNLHDFTIKNRS